jgi:outer membrane protein OmpA-like peptidoglycan-associated protein
MKLLMFLLFASVGAYGSNYVVIGAFAKKENAIALSQRAKGEYDINPAKQLYYVFLLKTEDNAAAFAEARRLQTESPYKDAWVFIGVLGEEKAVVEEPEPIINEPIVVETPKEELPKQDPPKEESPVVEPPKENQTDIALDPKISKKDFFFSVLFEDGTPANGAEVTVIEPKSQRKEYVLKGNENATIRAINQSGEVRLECDLVGYRKVIQTINFKEPTSVDGITIDNNRIIVPFTLTRLKKGDYSVLYNVFFYKDAAIMRPESKSDLEGLLEMMKENPTYRIRIHGHTNGNASGPILEAGSGDLFSLNNAKEGRGSAKKLSQKRAEAIRDYLAKQGIEPARMETRAWGGKKPIYDKHHTQAAANVRVEVEVIEE